MFLTLLPNVLGMVVSVYILAVLCGMGNGRADIAPGAETTIPRCNGFGVVHGAESLGDKRACGSD